MMLIKLFLFFLLLLILPDMYIYKAYIRLSLIHISGLLAGAQTISAVIGVAEDTINGLNISSSQKSDMINIIPVAYAVTSVSYTHLDVYKRQDVHAL